MHCLAWDDAFVSSFFIVLLTSFWCYELGMIYAYFHHDYFLHYRGTLWLSYFIMDTGWPWCVYDCQTELLCHIICCKAFCVLYYSTVNKEYWGTGIRGLMRGMATFPQGNQELLMVKYKVGRPPGELGLSKSMECEIFPLSTLMLLVGQQEGHLVCKEKLEWCVCWWWWSLALHIEFQLAPPPPPLSLASLQYRIIWHSDTHLLRLSWITDI